MSIPLAIKAGLVAAGLFAMSSKSKATNPTGKKPVSKLLIKILFKRIHSFKQGKLELVYNINPQNPASQPQAITEAYLLLQVSADNGMNWTNIGASDSKVPSIAIPAGNSKPLPTEIPLLINITQTFNSLLSKSNKYRLVLKFSFGGVEKQVVQSYDFTSALQKVPGFSGIEHVHHTPNSGTKRAIIRNIIIQIKQVYPYAFSVSHKEVAHPGHHTQHKHQGCHILPAHTVKKAHHHKPQPQAWKKPVFHKPDYRMNTNPNRISIPQKFMQVIKPGVGEASPLV